MHSGNGFEYTEIIGGQGNKRRAQDPLTAYLLRALVSLGSVSLCHLTGGLTVLQVLNTARTTEYLS